MVVVVLKKRMYREKPICFAMELDKSAVRLFEKLKGKFDPRPTKLGIHKGPDPQSRTYRTEW